jgi:hypothetical protein
MLAVSYFDCIHKPLSLKDITQCLFTEPEIAAHGLNPTREIQTSLGESKGF